jgi:hypothetical protein
VEILEYGVKLADYMSPAAKSAREAMDKLSKSLTTAKTDLAGYQAQFQKAKILGDVGGMTKYADAYNSTYKSVYSLSQQLGDIPKVTATAGEQFTALAGELGAIAGPAAAVLGAITSVVGGFVALTIAGAALAIEATEARDQLVTMFDALGEGDGAGEATIAMLDGLEGQLGQTRVKLSEWTQEYEALGITDLSELRYQITATGASYAIMGDKGANAYAKLETKIQEAIDTGHGIKIADKGLAALGQTGANVNDVATRMGLSAAELRNQLKKGTADAAAFGDALSEAIIEKGQGPLENLRTDLGTITAHAHESFTKLFDSVDDEPFKVQLADLVGIMDQGTASGDALKWGIKSFLDEAFNLGTEALPVVKHFFLEMIDEALVLYIALKPAIKEFNKLGGASVFIDPLIFQFKVLGGMIENTAEATAYLLSLFAKVEGFAIRANSFGLIGDKASQGVADGIRGGKEKVTAASADMAGGAKDGATKELEVKSPSRVGIRIGEHFGTGIAGGVRQSNRVVERASMGIGETMAEAPRMGFAPVARAAEARVSGAASFESPYASHDDKQAMTINVGGLHFTGHDQQSAQELTEVGVASLFERLAAQVGR